MVDSNNRERFGRYLILDHLVDGGMAKICRARFLGEQADKVVAIKMVQPQYSKDEAFKTMFMDEIKVTFGLIHPNIVQTYDYGMQRDQLFVAMEYCDGRNLKEYLDKLKERKFVFPVEISTYIISQVCQGLYYAHTFRDKLTGQEANIVHRDISPHNIMLTYDGAVKIIDFGIAKSQTNSEATQAGTIKGKLSYLAPEYLEGLELDARYDQFAVGITLWEMLCSRKLFKENNDLAVLKKIQECKIPVPSSINPNVPKELDEIVLKALSKNRKNRFENLDQMNRALMKFLYSKYSDFNATDLSYFAQELFREEIKKDHEKMFEFGKIDIRPYLEELKDEAERGSGARSTKSSGSSKEDEQPTIKKEAVLDFGFEEVNVKKKNTITVKKSQVAVKAKLESDSTNPKRMASADGTANPVLDKKTITRSSVSKKIIPKEKDHTRSAMNIKSSDMKTNTKVVKGVKGKKEKESETSPFVKIVAMLILVAGAGYYFFMDGPSNSTEAVVTTEPKEKDKRTPAQIEGTSEITGNANLILTHYDKKRMQVFIDDSRVVPSILSAITVPVGRPFTLRVESEGKKHFVKEMNLGNNSDIEVEIPNMPQTGYGYLFTSNICRTKGQIRFEVYGEKRVSNIPMNSGYGIAFPLDIDSNGNLVAAKHDIYYKKDGDAIEQKIEITFKREDQSIDICEYL